MWCTRCEQDVPGLASPKKRGFICIRCGGPLEMPQKSSFFHEPHHPSEGKQPRLLEGSSCQQHPSSSPSKGPPSSLSPSKEGFILPFHSFLGYDDWEMEQALRHIGRRIGTPQDSPLSRPSLQWCRVDPAHEEAWGTHWTKSKNWSLSSKGTPPQRRWPNFLLCSGLMSLICGTILLLWSYLSGQEELYLWGWPLLVLGQAGLVVAVTVPIFFKPSIPPGYPSAVPPPSQKDTSLKQLFFLSRPDPLPPPSSETLGSFQIPSFPSR